MNVTAIWIMKVGLLSELHVLFASHFELAHGKRMTDRYAMLWLFDTV
jgi:hypothetical protein